MISVGTDDDKLFISLTISYETAQKTPLKAKKKRLNLGSKKLREIPAANERQCKDSIWRNALPANRGLKQKRQPNYLAPEHLQQLSSSVPNSTDSIKLVVIPAVGAGNAVMSAGDGVVAAPIVVVRALGFVVGNFQRVRVGIKPVCFSSG
jgi:hypothetical protein